MDLSTFKMRYTVLMNDIMRDLLEMNMKIPQNSMR